uniref:Uncharacterized protein n=1 Tax=Mucochytrium quahogii TaxID=96639 RepID=A0A7S2SQ52_9STRA|mmetsp:Transcript_9716/g.15937  ORF Transcript_9716/g.15937 Transcript_9716/m.15937 type:complete len:270 (+) Transcript_9716:139-948(+)
MLHFGFVPTGANLSGGLLQHQRFADVDLTQFLDGIFEADDLQAPPQRTSKEQAPREGCETNEEEAGRAKLLDSYESGSTGGYSTDSTYEVDHTKPSEVADESKKSGMKIYYRRTWTDKEDQQLLALVQKFGAKRWSKLARHIPGKTGNQCSQRWHKALDPNIIKGKWTKVEDEALVNAVKTVGRKWKQISNSIPGRTGKQCRDRYTSRLDPNLVTGKWTQEEENVALHWYKVHGNRWAAIQKELPHRSWYTIKWKIESILKNSTCQNCT